MSLRKDSFSFGTLASPNRAITLLLNSPRHRADEAFRRRRRVCGAYLQDLCNQGWIVGNPIPHDDPTAGPRYPHHFLCHIKWLWREHGAKDAHDEIEGVVLLVRADRKRRPPETCMFVETVFTARAFPAATRLLAISMPKTSAPSFASGRAVVPSPQPRSKTLNPFVIPSPATSASPLSPHALGNAREVALFPERFVRIH